ncbi:TPA: hypothetical protein ACJJXW_000480 [Enterobacter cloacae]|uniref:hypothetical protein n=1 Tax=Enterobacter TaxID=547 RepID=UPI0004A711BE|nr:MULTISPECIES: hypothetical protein [Enterobacter]MBT1532815.1 hypothetical protein [Enterobacter cloacae]MCK7214390.1 hypothetical protein [Enterobacter kobei]GFM10209.1 hypothetical protein NCT2013_26270 [Enterobacter sp. M4-VN]HCM9506041.1 hypothetical protein [Enterobacter kobei]HDZ8318647.1 hypothetical protein [Enterobacter kobei]
MRVKAGNLQDYLKATTENASFHYETHPDLMGMVLRMDQVFHEEIFADDLVSNPYAQLLAMNSYSLLLNGVGQAISGHTVAIFPVLRTALESACYAFLIAKNEELGVVWINRHNSESALQRCRKKLTVKRACEKLSSFSPEMAEYVMAHYDASIDYGAHPNQKAILNHLSDIGEVDSNFHGFELTSVYGENSWHVNYALLVCTEVGQAVAYLLAASCDNHPLLNDRLEVFADWFADKIQIADELNGKPIDYPMNMYSSITALK